MDHTDGLLTEIVSRAEKDPSFSLGLSILVDGVFVSGTITSASSFREALKLGDTAVPDETGAPTYIHLRNVRFYAGSGQQIEERSTDSFWRCRIDAVTGFKLGTLHHLVTRLGESEQRRRFAEA